MAVDNCIQYKKDVNPCSPTYQERQIFKVPCPPTNSIIISEPVGTGTSRVMISNVNTDITNLNIKVSFTRVSDQSYQEVYINSNSVSIDLPKGVYKICLYCLLGNYLNTTQLVDRADNSIILINTCRNNIQIYDSINYDLTAYED
jgi:hypothetical protein